MIRFIVIAGYDYYPNPGSGDWQGVFSEHEPAKELAESLKENYDWVEIVDLEEWE